LFSAKRYRSNLIKITPDLISIIELNKVARELWVRIVRLFYSTKVEPFRFWPKPNHSCPNLNCSNAGIDVINNSSNITGVMLDFVSIIKRYIYFTPNIGNCATIVLVVGPTAKNTAVCQYGRCSKS
jgi:hypothetical protein